jgi:hypothetical protein
VAVVQTLFQLLQHPPLAGIAALLDLAIPLGKLRHHIPVVPVLGKSSSLTGLCAGRFCEKMATSTTLCHVERDST